MGTSVLHIKTDLECRGYLFDEMRRIDCYCPVSKLLCSTQLH